VIQSIILHPNYSFCPFSSTTSPSYPSTICHHTTPPSYILTGH
jgi:hypothetical protein